VPNHQQRGVRQEEIFQARGKHQGRQRPRVRLEKVQLQGHQAEEPGNEKVTSCLALAS